MGDLNTVFCDVPLESPVLIAPSPATASFAVIKELNRLGLGGIVIKSISTLESNAPNRRHLYYDDFCLYSTGLLQGEVIDIEKGSRLARCAKKLNLGVVASILGDSKSTESWSDLVIGVNNTCADIIELNLRYIFPSPRAYPFPSESELEVSSTELISNLRHNLNHALELCRLSKELSDKPIIAKLFPDYMTSLFAMQCEKGGIDGVTLVNSLPTIAPPKLPTGAPPYPFVSGHSYSMCSGSVLRPMVYKYIYEVKRATGLDICACGGIQTATHVLEAIMLGADVCQIGTAILVKGREYIRQLLVELRDYAKQFGIKRLRNIGLKYIVPSEKRQFHRCHALVRTKESCRQCSKCPVNSILCGAIDDRGEDRFPCIDQKKCYGCGLCVEICKQQNILLIETTD